MLIRKPTEDRQEYDKTIASKYASTQLLVAASILICNLVSGAHLPLRNKGWKMPQTYQKTINSIFTN
jgi:hypothetical protein